MEQRIQEMTRYLHSNLLIKASWGLGALQTVTVPAADEESGNGDAPARENATYVPSMTYFGVDTKEAVWMRMVGMPRPVARSFGQAWRYGNNGEPQSHQHLRSWIDQMSPDQWDSALPTNVSITGSDLKTIWQHLAV
jgi:hypothetical protein